LGQIFLTPFEGRRAAWKVAVATLLLVGVGEPGHLAPDDLRFALANVTVVVKALGHNHFSTELIGSRRHELSIERALQGFLQGVLDGYAHLRAMVEAMTESRVYVRQAADEPLFISLVENDRLTA